LAIQERGVDETKKGEEERQGKHRKVLRSRPWTRGEKQGTKEIKKNSKAEILRKKGGEKKREFTVGNRG